MARATLADQVLQAFHQAYRDGRLEVADHLFAALEAMPEADLPCACKELGQAPGSRGEPAASVTISYKSPRPPTKLRRITRA